MSISAFHEAARAYAEAGWPVFPCLPGDKKPACENGLNDATTDLATIDAWWTENPEYNPACPIHLAGKCVVDIDGPEGEAAWAKLCETYDTPPTYEVRTPRGGRHLYFEGELPMTAWAPGRKRCLGEHIDTRGVGSYVLIPPARITTYQDDAAQFNGNSYGVIRDADIAPVPSWCVTILSRRNERARSAGVELDTPGSISRARTHVHDRVRAGRVAVSGRGGNNTTYELAAELFEIGVSPEQALSILRDEFNPACQPPWSDDELETIVRNAATFAQNEPGAWAAAPAAETFAKALDQLPPSTQPERRSRFYFEDDAEQDTARDPVWLIPEIIPDGATVLMVGATGSFKSFLAQHIALAVATKQKFADIEPLRSGPAFYGAHEGRNELKKKRKRAWKGLHDVKDPIPFFVAPAPRVASPEECEEFREQIRVRLRQSVTPISLIVLDTVAKCMVGLNENDARDIGVFVGFCDSLRDEFDCSILVLHHTGKDEQRGSRGSSALQAGFDTTLTVKRVPKTKLVQMEITQHKDAEERAVPFYFEGKSIGATLVFQPISSDAFNAARAEDNPFVPSRIGAALRRLEAIGKEHAISTQVLFTELVPGEENASVEAREVEVAHGIRYLNKLARTVLKAYAEHRADGWWWSLPS